MHYAIGALAGYKKQLTNCPTQPHRARLGYATNSHAHKPSSFTLPSQSRPRTLTRFEGYLCSAWTQEVPEVLASWPESSPPRILKNSGGDVLAPSLTEGFLCSAWTQEVPEV